VTWTYCACGHRDTEHYPFTGWDVGCLFCGCDLYEPELRVISTTVPFDWARDGDL
jgi:hypothetical protein